MIPAYHGKVFWKPHTKSDFFDTSRAEWEGGEGSILGVTLMLPDVSS